MNFIINGSSPHPHPFKNKIQLPEKWQGCGPTEEMLSSKLTNSPCAHCAIGPIKEITSPLKPHLSQPLCKTKICRLQTRVSPQNKSSPCKGYLAASKSSFLHSNDFLTVIKPKHLFLVFKFPLQSSQFIQHNSIPDLPAPYLCSTCHSISNSFELHTCNTPSLWPQH